MATTLRDALSEAFDKVEEVAEPEQSIVPETAPEPEGEVLEARVRDDKGRFAKIEQETPEPEPEVIQEPPVARKAPSSWKKDYWGHWERISADPELSPLADYIEQREGEFAKGVSTYKAEADRGRALVEAVTPYEPILRQHGLEPAQHIRSLMDAHYALAMGSPEQKLQMFAKLATDYGVALQALNGQADPQMSRMAEELATVKRQQNAFAAMQEQQRNAEAQQQIAVFQQDHPHFEDVRETMAQLLERGMASDLESAYQKAIRLNDDVWTKTQAQQAQEKALQAQKAIAAKKATAVSPKSSAPSAVAPVAGKKGLRDQLSENLDAILTGRV